MCTVIMLHYLWVGMILLYYVVLYVYNINDIDKYSHNIHYVTYVTLYIILYITLLTYYTTYIPINNSSS